MTTVTKDFLVELGTEELPPTQLKTLSDAFTQGIEAGLAEAGLSSSSEGNIEVISYAAPRRLAVLVKNLATKQEDRDEVIFGPPANIAFDADGNPTKAALGFAKKSGARIVDFCPFINRVTVDGMAHGCFPIVYLDHSASLRPCFKNDVGCFGMRCRHQDSLGIVNAGVCVYEALNKRTCHQPPQESCFTGSSRC